MIWTDPKTRRWELTGLDVYYYYYTSHNRKGYDCVSCRLLFTSLHVKCAHQANRYTSQRRNAIISGIIQSTPIPWIYTLSNIPPMNIQREQAAIRECVKIREEVVDRVKRDKS